MKYVLDIAAVGVVVLFACIGAGKGFIKSCADFLGTIIAMIGAGIFSGAAAEWVFDTFFHEALTEKVTELSAGLSEGEAVHAVFNRFPEMIQRALTAAGITEGSVVAQLQSGTTAVAEGITEALRPMLVGLISAMTMVVLFVLLLVIVRALATLLTGLFELPLLHGINTALGVVFGALMAVPVIWVVLACVRALTPILAADMQASIQKLMDGSLLAGAFYSFNPTYWLLG